MNAAFIDLITRIKNGYLAKKENIESPHSIFREEILKKLVALGYIKNYQVEADKIKQIKIELLYSEGIPALTDIRIYSTPGRRFYVAVKDIKQVFRGVGEGLLSTSKGILTASEARQKKVGGELLFEVW